MGFAKLPTQPPQFDATALMLYLQHLGENSHTAVPTSLLKQFIAHKRWVEATTEYDGTGLRDVVAANALGLNAVKADADGNAARITALTERVATLEARPQVPFPGSGP